MDLEEPFPYFHNILFNDLRIVANRFDKEELEAHFLDHDVPD